LSRRTPRAVIGTAASHSEREKVTSHKNWYMN
jgi:hypothetical protein